MFEFFSLYFQFFHFRQENRRTKSNNEFTLIFFFLSTSKFNFSCLINRFKIKLIQFGIDVFLIFFFSKHFFYSNIEHTQKKRIFDNNKKNGRIWFKDVFNLCLFSLASGRRFAMSICLNLLSSRNSYEGSHQYWN